MWSRVLKGGLARLRRRPALAAALIYLLLAVAFVSPALVGGQTLSASDYQWVAPPWIESRPDAVRPSGGANGELADSVSQFQPFMRFARDSLPSPPLWNPHVMAGRPFLANAQSAVFSPFTVPAYVLPFWDSLAVIAILKLFVAAFGTYLLGRALGMRFGGALVSGLVFGFGLFFVAWLPWPLTSVWAFLPWLLLGAERMARAPGPLPAAGLAVVVALQFFGGHPESSFHVLFGALAFFALRLARVPEATWRVSARRTIAFAGALVAGTALAAVAVVPFAELLLLSGDIDRRGHTPALSVDPKYLPTLLMPDYWGRPTGYSLGGFYVERAFYAGALPLMLAFAGLVIRPTLERAAVAAFGVLVLLVVVGVFPFFEIVTALPGFSTAHNTRLTVLFLICVALLAGFGLDELTARRARVPRARLVLAGIVALFCVPLVWAVVARPSPAVFGTALDLAWGFADPRRPEGPPAKFDFHSIRLAALIVWIGVAGAAVLLVGLRLRARVPATTFAALAVGLIVLDLFRAGMGQNPAIPEEHAQQPVTGTIRHIEAHRPARFAGIYLPGSVVPLPANVAMPLGLYDARGYDYPVERRYDRLWRRAVAPAGTFAPPTTLAQTTPEALRVLRLLGVRDLIEQRFGSVQTAAGLRLAYDGRDARVYENVGALPRVWLTGSQRVVGSEHAALEAVVSADDTDPLRTAITETAVPGIPRIEAGVPARAAAGDARLERYDAERVTIAARAARPSLLVLSDVHYPGWKARVDGEEVKVERVNYLLRGVALEPGAHRVEFRYEPLSWRIGWIVSLLALCCLLGTVALGVRRPRA